MKKYGLDYSHKSIRESVLYDYTGRNQNLRKFIEFLNLQKEHSKIALDGEWGSGKTYFIKQLEYILNINDKYSDDKKMYELPSDSWVNNIDVNYEVIYFDSWKHESENIDPIISLFNTIQKNYTGNNLQDALRLVVKYIAPIVQFNTKGIIKSEDFVDSIDKLFNDKNDPIDDLNRALNNYLNEIPDNNRLVIVIDELDRCKPTYAINLLERVQHCLDNKKLTFVFSTNLSELSNTVKQIYGANFNGDSYLDRFFDYTLLLPEPNLENYYEKVIAPENHDIFYIAKEVAKHFNFTLRQLNHYFSRISLLENKMTKLLNSGLKVDDEYQKHYFLIKYFATFMIALKMVNSAEYNEFLKGNGLTKITDFLKKINNFSYDFTLLLSNMTEEEIIKTIYTGIFLDNQSYNKFSFPLIRGAQRRSGYDVHGNTNADKEYLLDIVSLIGEDIEY